MCIKLKGNGLWEFSRMMLPEHVNAVQEHDRVSKEAGRVELDEQEWDLILGKMQQAIQQRLSATISLFDPYEELMVIGIIERVDQLGKRFRVDGEWFPFEDILSVDLT